MLLLLLLLMTSFTLSYRRLDARPRVVSATDFAGNVERVGLET